MIDLDALGACSPAIEWYEARSGTDYDRWRRCPRGDWLLWFAARVDVDPRLIVRAACACAREVLVHVPEGEDRPRKIIEMAEAWGKGGNVPRKKLRGASCVPTAGIDSMATFCVISAVNAIVGMIDMRFMSCPNVASDIMIDIANAAHSNMHVAGNDAYRKGDIPTADMYYFKAKKAYKASLARSAQLVRRIIPWRVIKEKL